MNQAKLEQQNDDDFDLSLEEINDDLSRQLDAEAERADYLLGLLASIRDLVGIIGIGLYKSNSKITEEVNSHDAIRSIDKLMPYLTSKQRRSVKSAIKFHDVANKMNKLQAHLKPAWHDDNPLNEIEQLNFTHVINRYY